MRACLNGLASSFVVTTLVVLRPSQARDGRLKSSLRTLFRQGLRAHDRRRQKKNRRLAISNRRLLYVLGAGILALALFVLVVGSRLGHLPPPLPRARMAAIIDQVALSSPNPEFIQQARSYLTSAGFSVDVYEGESITVEFLRTLPTRGYNLIVFRTHSTNDFIDPAPPGKPVFLYTGERHDRYRYTYEQLTRQIMAGRVLYEEDAPKLFIVGPEFVRHGMQGRFEGTLMLIGGCASLATPELAEAFLERGATAIIGWNGLVDKSHNDRALLHLLRLLTVDELPIEQAVLHTRFEIGPDPTFNSIPTFYPFDQGKYSLAIAPRLP